MLRRPTIKWLWMSVRISSFASLVFMFSQEEKRKWKGLCKRSMRMKKLEGQFVKSRVKGEVNKLSELATCTKWRSSSFCCRWTKIHDNEGDVAAVQRFLFRGIAVFFRCWCWRLQWVCLTYYLYAYYVTRFDFISAPTFIRLILCVPCSRHSFHWILLFLQTSLFFSLSSTVSLTSVILSSNSRFSGISSIKIPHASVSF